MGSSSAEELITAQRVREMITAEFLEALGDVDALVTPTMPYPAHRVDTTAPEGDMRSLVRPVSLTGLPALALPCGFTREGLPVSLQLIGRAWAEGTLLRIGYAYEQATAWYAQRPAPSASHLAPAPLEARLVDAPEIGTTDGRWVMDQARLMGLTFVRLEDGGRWLVDWSGAGPAGRGPGPIGEDCPALSASGPRLMAGFGIQSTVRQYGRPRLYLTGGPIRSRHPKRRAAGPSNSLTPD